MSLVEYKNGAINSAKSEPTYEQLRANIIKSQSLPPGTQLILYENDTLRVLWSCQTATEADKNILLGLERAFLSGGRNVKVIGLERCDNPGSSKYYESLRMLEEMGLDPMYLIPPLKPQS